MKPNDIVEIYQDPLSQEDSEGPARLLKCLDSNVGMVDGRQMQRWEVVFINDGYVCERIVG